MVARAARVIAYDRAMHIVIAHNEPGAALAWQRELLRRLPELQISIDPGCPDGAAGLSGARLDPASAELPPADIAVGWKPPADFFSRHPHLKAFFSTGAGVDHLLRHPGLPAGLVIIRLEDAGMGPLMADYCLHELLRIAGRHDAYEAQQRSRQWQELPAFAREELPIGIVGVGVLGAQVGAHLTRAGFTVRGFARSAKSIEGIEVMHGEGAWPAFLAASRVLILLAPHTPQTDNLIDAAALRLLQPQGWLINVARGALVVEADLIAELDSRRLAGATLDVFRREPLPADDPLWHHRAIRITPHVSAPTQVGPSAEQVAGKIGALARGERPSGQIDRQRGY
jgi:glyoxylate/hydroxypyruvate reductase A